MQTFDQYVQSLIISEDKDRVIIRSPAKINLGLQAEVSAIDPTQTVVGANYPVLKTRRTSTTVEVADGQSFAVAGLIQNDINNVIRRRTGICRCRYR